MKLPSYTFMLLVSYILLTGMLQRNARSKTEQRLRSGSAQSRTETARRDLRAVPASGTAEQMGKDYGWCGPSRRSETRSSQGGPCETEGGT